MDGTARQQFRWLARRLPGPDDRGAVVLTGARQSGKTTLARRLYPDLRYLDLDDAKARETVRSSSKKEWADEVGETILDEAQKQPSAVGKAAAACKNGSVGFTALLGSTRDLLDSVPKGLRGGGDGALVLELWPLMLSELLARADEEPPRPLLDRLLGADAGGGVAEVLGAEDEILVGPEDRARRTALEHLERWGGMPALLPLGQQGRKSWLGAYQQSYLERDLADLAKLPDLRPFRMFQRLLTLRSGRRFSYIDLAKGAGVVSSTARRYLELLDLTHQIVRLPPFDEPLTGAVIKYPKLYWFDPGLLRQVSAQWGATTEAVFETLVVVECRKWIQTAGADAELFFYRTRSGREVDLLIRTPAGLIGLEIKNLRSAAPAHAESLQALGEGAGERWLGGIVVYRGAALRPLADEGSAWAVPAHRLF